MEPPKGIETKEHLRDWMLAREMHNIVLRQSDVLRLQPFLRQAVDILMTRIPEHRMSPDGYLVFPTTALCKHLTLDELEGIQEIVASYREERRRNGDPSKTIDCDTCKGAGCDDCKGKGKVTVLCEQSDRELELVHERSA
jgi:hypothetical protein